MPSTGVWYCKIGECDPGVLPNGSDYPMRKAVEKAYKELTGKDCEFNFSGWGQALTESERAVVEDRLPDRRVQLNAALERVRELSF